MSNPSEPVTITPSLLRGWPVPVPEGGKDVRGTVLVIGGSRFTPGAVLLTGVAALRAGAGVLQLAVAESTAAALSMEVPEAAVIDLPETRSGSIAGEPPRRLLDLAAAARTIVIGPGLDDVDLTGKLMRHVLDAAAARAGVLLDAYALGALSHDPDLLHGRTQDFVLTPNLVEARYLLDREPGDDLAAEAATIAARYRAVVSLYGHIATPAGRAWREDGGDVGLGTSGSGDVRTGIVAGLMARGADAAQAACWGAYVHATSGQRLIPRYGRVGYLARDLLDEIAPTLTMV